jgi:hypothetical protein
MKYLFLTAVCAVVVSTLAPSSAQKAVGKCMRADCAAMQAYCQESKAAGKTQTNCEAAGAQCTKNKKWVGKSVDGKAWSCTF